MIQDIDRRAKEEIREVFKKAEKVEAKAAGYRHYHIFEAPLVEDVATAASVLGADTSERACGSGADFGLADVGPVVLVLNVVLKAGVRGGADAVAQASSA